MNKNNNNNNNNSLNKTVSSSGDNKKPSNISAISFNEWNRERILNQAANRSNFFKLSVCFTEEGKVLDQKHNKEKQELRDTFNCSISVPKGKTFNELRIDLNSIGVELHSLKQNGPSKAIIHANDMLGQPVHKSELVSQPTEVKKIFYDSSDRTELNCSISFLNGTQLGNLRKKLDSIREKFNSLQQDGHSKVIPANDKPELSASEVETFDAFKRKLNSIGVELKSLKRDPSQVKIELKGHEF